VRRGVCRFINPLYNAEHFPAARTRIPPAPVYSILIPGDFTEHFIYTVLLRRVNVGSTGGEYPVRLLQCRRRVAVPGIFRQPISPIFFIYFCRCPVHPDDDTFAITYGDRDWEFSYPSSGCRQVHDICLQVHPGRGKRVPFKPQLNRYAHKRTLKTGHPDHFSEGAKRQNSGFARGILKYPVCYLNKR
jgi:hypothetical protein